ncbi:hypothetical protein ACP70R_003897 [Stipagrostis hirtigluma subsp. patula]
MEFWLMTTETAPVVSGESHSATRLRAGDNCKSDDDHKEAGEGLSDDTEIGLFLVSLLIRGARGVGAVPPASATRPAAAVVWRLWLLACGCLAVRVGALSGAGARAVLFRASYAALAAFAVGNRLSAAAGMVAIFLEAVCVAGFFGYYLACVHRTNTAVDGHQRIVVGAGEESRRRGSRNLR